MKAFQSSLSALRTLRERQEQEALHAYGQTLHAQEQARARLDQARHELTQCWLGLHRLLAEGGLAGELDRLQAYTQTLEQRRLDCERALLKARQVARRAFTRLLAARQARTVVDRLLEAQRRRYRRKQQRDEQKQLDELASRRNTLFTLLQMTREPQWN